jgi:phenylacetate-CoA ligase
VPHGRDIAKGLATGEIELVATSGTTADQVTNVWYQPWWDATEAASWQLNAHARAAATGTHREAILTSPWCTGVPCEEGYLPIERRTLERFLYLTERSDPSSWSSAMMDRMVDELDVFKPTVLEANPSFLTRLSRHIVSRRLHVRSPALIILTYENPSILHYRQIGRAFDTPIVSSYGATEAGHVFIQCEAGRFHQVTACCHVDFLPFTPEHGGPDVGRILVTTFDNPWRSLVRFDIGDAVRLDDGTPCPCGCREGLTLASMEGRTVNLTLTPEGRAVTQGMVDRALATVTGLIQYQVLQTGPAAYRLRLVGEEAQSDRVAAAAGEALQAMYGPAAAITVEAVGAIAPDPPGKYRLARPLDPINPDTLVDERYAPRLS